MHRIRTSLEGEPLCCPALPAPAASLPPRLGVQGRRSNPVFALAHSSTLQGDQLHEAATHGGLLRVRTLLRADAALHRAAAAGHDAVITALAQAGADVDAPDCMGRRPLHYAARQGHVDAIQALLLAGAAVDAPSAKGWTALHSAAAADQPGAAAALVMAGASPEAQNAAGQSAWDCAGERVRQAMREPRAELGLAELPSQPSLLQWWVGRAGAHTCLRSQAHPGLCKPVQACMHAYHSCETGSHSARPWFPAGYPHPRRCSQTPPLRHTRGLTFLWQLTRATQVGVAHFLS